MSHEMVAALHTATCLGVPGVSGGFVISSRPRQPVRAARDVDEVFFVDPSCLCRLPSSSLSLRGLALFARHRFGFGTSTQGVDYAHT